jgi:hypothetical protein
MKDLFRAPVVEKLCHYLLFRHHHITTRDDQSTSKGSAHNFDDQIPIELALQLLVLHMHTRAKFTHQVCTHGLLLLSLFRLECADFLDIVSHYALTIFTSNPTIVIRQLFSLILVVCQFFHHLVKPVLEHLASNHPFQEIAQIRILCKIYNFITRKACSL